MVRETQNGECWCEASASGTQCCHVTGYRFDLTSKRFSTAYASKRFQRTSLTISGAYRHGDTVTAGAICGASWKTEKAMRIIV